MIYLKKHEQYEYWLYTATDNVYSCEEAGDGLVWYDGNSWTLESESLCEKLTNARAEALARMPKRVEITIKNDAKTNYIDESYTSQKIYGELQKLKVNGVVKVIIEEVKE